MCTCIVKRCLVKENPLPQLRPEQIEAAPFVRLHALVQKGYHANLGVTRDTNQIALEHPRGASAGAPDLILKPDGVIVGINNERPINSSAGSPGSIGVSSEADWQLFKSFVDSVPEPTLRQAFDKTTIWEVRMRVIIFFICAGLTAGLVYLATRFYY